MVLPQGKCSLITYINASAIDKFQRELLLSHTLLFSNKPTSKSIGERFYGFNIDLLNEMRRRYPENPNRVHELSDFSILRPRILRLFRCMDEWKPRTFQELFISGYSGRLEWWVAMFAGFVGIISLLSLAVSCYQAFLGQRQLTVTLEGSNI